MKTNLCHVLGIEHPIIAAPMGPDLTGPNLVAAVSNAGGLGFPAGTVLHATGLPPGDPPRAGAHRKAVRGEPASPLPRRGSGRHLPGRACARPLPVLG